MPVVRGIGVQQSSSFYFKLLNIIERHKTKYNKILVLLSPQITVQIHVVHVAQCMKSEKSFMTFTTAIFAWKTAEEMVSE